MRVGGPSCLVEAARQSSERGCESEVETSCVCVCVGGCVGVCLSWRHRGYTRCVC